MPNKLLDPTRVGKPSLALGLVGLFSSLGVLMSNTTEEELVAAGRGKWSAPGVPHKGWVCIDIEDLGEPQTECEMCESRTIRYVHHMEHPDYSTILAVGCVCAGHMEGDLDAARSRDASMQSRASKRSRWTTRKWKISKNGNPTIKADGFRVTVYERSNGWAATVSPMGGSGVIHGRRNYPTMNQAKLAAFDEITRLQSANNG
ncbi:hypothetical protein [Ideonella azotifigens]|uniref:hypothetical protein n=1 Tax=Ideonella azotifigens TaxID=513160 RepID=UPI0031DD751A